MAERNWNGETPASTPELDEIILGCRTAAEIREKTLQYWQKQGVAMRDETGYSANFVPQAQTFSRELSFRDGTRCRVEGCRSVEELNAMEQALRTQRDK
jgi:hypothetical protein